MISFEEMDRIFFLSCWLVIFHLVDCAVGQKNGSDQSDVSISQFFNLLNTLLKKPGFSEEFCSEYRHLSDLGLSDNDKAKLAEMIMESETRNRNSLNEVR